MFTAVFLLEVFFKFFIIFHKVSHSLLVNFYMSKRKAILFGGTFDPIHRAHTTIAAVAAERMAAEKVVFIPAKRSPLKECPPQASDEERLQMIALAIAGNNSFEVSDYELNKSEPSYTLETVRYFKATYGRDVLVYWLIGADSIGELTGWYRVEELLDECNLSVMHRGGFERPDLSRFVDIWGTDRVKKLQKNVIKTPLIDISSTEIRRRLVDGKDVKEMLAPRVYEYIQERGLYR